MKKKGTVTKAKSDLASLEFSKYRILSNKEFSATPTCLSARFANNARITNLAKEKNAKMIKAEGTFGKPRI